MDKSNGGYYIHPDPKYTGYVANEEGKVLNTKTGNEINGEITESKAISIKANGKRILKHIFIYECVKNEIINIKTDVITHIDSNKSNNKVANLKKIIKNNKKMKNLEKYQSREHKIKTLLNDGYFKHPDPEFKNLFTNENGNVFNIEIYKEVKGSLNNSGYLKIKTSKKTIVKHKFIYECINNEIVDSTLYDIDHIDSNKLNNNMNNLQKLTKKEHGEKTHLGKISTHGIAQGTKIIRFKRDKMNKEYDVKEYLTITSASKDMKAVGSGGIYIALKNNNRTAYGYYWKYSDQLHIKNEKWEDLSTCWNFFNPTKEQNNFIGYKISSLGRLKNPLDKIASGTFHNGYKQYTIKGTRYPAHRLVCVIFNGIPKTKELVVDHINRNKLDNSHKNLRWVTQKENTDHSISKPVIAYQNGIKIGTFLSYKDASDNLGISASNICNYLSGKYKNRNGYTFEFAQK